MLASRSHCAFRAGFRRCSAQCLHATRSDPAQDVWVGCAGSWRKGDDGSNARHVLGCARRAIRGGVVRGSTQARNWSPNRRPDLPLAIPSPVGRFDPKGIKVAAPMLREQRSPCLPHRMSGARSNPPSTSALPSLVRSQGPGLIPATFRNEDN